MNNDSILEQNIREQLKSVDILKPCLSTINIRVKDGVATLSGWVDSLEQRLSAMEIASSTPGIKSVLEELQVGSSIHRLDVDVNWETGDMDVNK